MVTTCFKLVSRVVEVDNYLINKVGLRTQLFGDKVALTILRKEHLHLSLNEVALCLKGFGHTFISYEQNALIGLTQNAK